MDQMLNIFWAVVALVGIWRLWDEMRKFRDLVWGISDDILAIKERIGLEIIARTPPQFYRQAKGIVKKLIEKDAPLQDVEKFIQENDNLRKEQKSLLREETNFLHDQHIRTNREK